MAARRIILVTGANSGIGYDTSYAAAAASPSNHVIMGCRSLAKGAKALEELQARKPAGTLSLLELDVTNDSTIKAAVDKISADFGVLDALVNNAGIYIRDAQDRRSEILDTLNTNTVGPLVLTEALLPLLRKSKDPRIINVSSALGSITDRFDASLSYHGLPAEAYRMSKAALNMATACMHTAYAPWGARVWAFCPGYVVTNLSGEADRQLRRERGADSAETSAAAILEILDGKRDGEAGSFVRRNGQRFLW
ncbi:(+)-neomenthol dehydrogenase [Tolypocladium ophioglossoides CBS 100239]|uniref:(+)-neomenthol dehydrogenase n=1 Tax=Tolypocladium ophioglossoides (strain CBS 100239) TaxID=1163406 RepID=A0A0L0NHW4_TOLOC|nr:(+)-neomenthol dehydrogenase [Tolypocladium ophioglossoides CBS 100239]